MTVTVQKGRACGTVAAPASKSMGHRLLICAALAKGKSTVRGITDSADLRATLACLSALGVQYERTGDTITMEGIDISQSHPDTPLLCGESGSTLRFFIPLAMLSGNHTLFSGAESLFRRPMSVYETMARERGLLFSLAHDSVVVKGPLTAGEYTVAGNVSSQFISGLLFALPLLKEDSVIHITPPLESRSYILLTMQALAAFGVTAHFTDDLTIEIPGGQHYTPCDITVEGDYSGAAFLAALDALGGDVSVMGLREDSLQGDRVYRRFFPMLLRGTPTIHIGDCPDLGPILFALAAACNGAIFTGTARLRMKESDRVAVMAEELSRFGVTVRAEENSVLIYPSDLHAPTEPLQGHNDHRIVMALSVLCTLFGGEIEGAEAVDKSFPDFFLRLQELGIGITKKD